MSFTKLITSSIKDSIATKKTILETPALLSLIEEMVQSCLTSLKQGGKIIFAGNGGSFADAQHLSAEFTSRYAIDRDSLPSLALGCNSSLISAIGKDLCKCFHVPSTSTRRIQESHIMIGHILCSIIEREYFES